MTNGILFLLLASLLVVAKSFTTGSGSRVMKGFKTYPLSMAVITDPVKKINGVVISPALLRSVGPLITAKGDRVALGDVMGTDKSVVIFLRHLG
jgi:hypothetical protein